MVCSVSSIRLLMLIKPKVFSILSVQIDLKKSPPVDDPKRTKVAYGEVAYSAIYTFVVVEPNGKANGSSCW